MGFYNNNMFFASLCLGTVLLQVAWIKVLPQKVTIIRKDTGKRLVEVVFCVCTAFAVSTLFRLFPGNNRFPTEDSSVFLYIGERMTEGGIPYRDFFDHKGPMLYFVEFDSSNLLFWFSNSSLVFDNSSVISVDIFIIFFKDWFSSFNILIFSKFDKFFSLFEFNNSFKLFFPLLFFSCLLIDIFNLLLSS